MKKDLTSSILALPYKGFFLACTVLNLLVVLFILILQSKLPPVVPLLYGLPVGEEQLVPKLLLTIPSLVSLFIIAINIFIASISKDSFGQKVLVGISIAVALLASITSIKIFFLVASF